MIRQLVSVGPEILDHAIKILHKNRLLIDYGDVVSRNNLSNVMIKVKCDQDGLKKVLGPLLKKSIIIRNPV